MMDRTEGAARNFSFTEEERGQIWPECFGRNPSDMKPSDSYSIAALMMQIEGWKRSDKLVSLPIYGRQRVYTRYAQIPDFLN